MRKRSVKIFLYIFGIIVLSFLVFCFAAGFKDLLQFIADDTNNAIFVGCIFAVGFMIIQLLLCYKTKHILIRLIPIFMLVVGFGLCLVLFFGGFGTGSFFGEVILAMICAITLSVASTGIAAAWIIFGIHKFINRLARKEQAL